MRLLLLEQVFNPIRMLSLLILLLLLFLSLRLQSLVDGRIRCSVSILRDSCSARAASRADPEVSLLIFGVLTLKLTTFGNLVPRLLA